MLSLSWNPQETPELLHTPLLTLGEEYPIVMNGSGTKLQFYLLVPGKSEVTINRDHVAIGYGTLADALRGVGSALAAINFQGTTTFKTLGIMLDCSRNGVMKVPHVKKWLRRLALMGYNMAMFYTEDTYKLPGEEYFGYMRGAYTAEEIRHIDDYAAKLGIEVIACIQVLGHLEQIFKWQNPYADIQDTPGVMMVDSEATAQLIDKMLQFWSDNLRSRRIHVGMDETHDLGRGRFLDIHGYQRGFDLFNRHLALVKSLCGKYALSPIIWSDMYFRMSNANLEYYDLEHDIPDDVAAAIPEDVTLSYWDYYHDDKDFYCKFIKKHQALNRPVLMASGVWTWGVLAHNFAKTIETVTPCIEACQACGIDEFLLTLWGDDGAYCDFDSALAGLSWAADAAYGNQDNEMLTAQRFEAICQASYLPQRIAGEVDLAFMTDYLRYEFPDRYWLYLGYRMLWDDPLLGIGWNNFKTQDQDFAQKALQTLSTLKEKLTPYATETAAGRVSHNLAVIEALITHLIARKEIVEAYASGNIPQLQQAALTLPPAIAAYQALYESFRTMWLDVFKPFGLETIQYRTGAIILRFEELARRLQEYCNGQVENIPELEETAPQDPCGNSYRTARVMSGSCI